MYFKLFFILIIFTVIFFKLFLKDGSFRDNIELLRPRSVLDYIFLAIEIVALGAAGYFLYKWMDTPLCSYAKCDNSEYLYYRNMTKGMVMIPLLLELFKIFIDKPKNHK